MSLCPRCVEMLINEQIRSYNEKLEEIEQLEHAEALAVNQLKLKRQNTVRTILHGLVCLDTTNSGSKLTFLFKFSSMLLCRFLIWNGINSNTDTYQVHRLSRQTNHSHQLYLLHTVGQGCTTTLLVQ